MSFCLMEQQRNENKEENTHISALLRKGTGAGQETFSFLGSISRGIRTC